jgi:hypothetical protein
MEKTKRNNKENNYGKKTKRNRKENITYSAANLIQLLIQKVQVKLCNIRKPHHHYSQYYNYFHSVSNLGLFVLHCVITLCVLVYMCVYACVCVSACVCV